MVRSAAKNHAYVTIVTDPADYGALVTETRRRRRRHRPRLPQVHGGQGLAATAAYDSAISQWFAYADQQMKFPPAPDHGVQAGRRRCAMARTRTRKPRSTCPRDRMPWACRRPSSCRARSCRYNNYNDANAALELVAEFADGPPTVVIVKHANPCGVAVGETLAEAWDKALACDSVSAFGGIVAANRPLDGATAEAIAQIFTEVVVAPGADEAARAVFAQQEEPAPADRAGAARSAPRGAQPGGHRWRAAGAGPRLRPCRSRDS